MTGRRVKETEVWSRLFRLLNRPNDFVKIRPVAGLEFGMEQFTIGANFEGAAARWNQRKRFNALAEFENLGRQTDGLRRVVSNDAVFD
jgi:protein involved in ribonucleotide reduction